MRRWLTLLCVLAGLCPATADAAMAPLPRDAGVALPRGVVELVAHVPAPGYPALPFVHGGRIYEGTYTAATGAGAHSHVFAFTPAGRLVADWTIADQPRAPYGIQVANADAAGDLVLLDDTSGRVLLLTPRTGRRRLYATIPDIPLCSAPGASAECSQALSDSTPEPDYAAWGPDGSLYVSDYQQAVIWRIPPGGGTPRIWLGGAALDGESFGTAGIWMEPDHRTLLVDQASNLGSASAAMVTGKLWSVPILPDGTPGTPRLLWSTLATALPDGFALARSGDIYLAQIGPSGNDIVELSPRGRRLATFGTPGLGSDHGPVPFDEPSGVAFDGSNLIVANQSYLLGIRAHQALLALGTGEAGAPVYIPRTAGPGYRVRHGRARG